VAVSLTLGLLTRLGALTAIWLNLNFLLLKGPTNPSGRIDWVFILMNVVIVTLAAGRTWGLDGVFEATFARAPVIRWFAGSRSGSSARIPVRRWNCASTAAHWLRRCRPT
jgi:hypothetical protein